MKAIYFNLAINTKQVDGEKWTGRNVIERIHEHV